jgi:hypothetical protein
MVSSLYSSVAYVLRSLIVLGYTRFNTFRLGSLRQTGRRTLDGLPYCFHLNKTANSFKRQMHLKCLLHADLGMTIVCFVYNWNFCNPKSEYIFYGLWAAVMTSQVARRATSLQTEDQSRRTGTNWLTLFPVRKIVRLSKSRNIALNTMYLEFEYVTIHIPTS